MKGNWNFKCPQCNHTDSLRGTDNEPQTWNPVCTNPDCQYGRGISGGMVTIGFTSDEDE